MSAPEQKDPETKDIEYNEEQKKILENIEKQIGKIKEIENITIGENESLVNIKEHLEPIPERIRKLRNELLEKLDALKKELKRLQDEAANDNSLKDITEMIKTSIKEIDNLTKETGSLTETKEKINQAIEDKIKEARDKELPDADQETKDIAKTLDEAGQEDQSAIINESLEDSQLQEIFKDETDEVREVVNKLSRQFKTSPGLYNTFKEELINEYNKQKPNGKLNERDIEKLINQGVIPTLVNNGVPVLDKDGKRIPVEGRSPMKAMNLSNIEQGKEVGNKKSERSKEAQQTRKQLPQRKGGKRTRKRRNSRKKKVVKRR